MIIGLDGVLVAYWLLLGWYLIGLLGRLCQSLTWFQVDEIDEREQLRIGHIGAKSGRSFLLRYSVCMLVLG